MDIKQLMQQMHDASTEKEKEQILDTIKSEFSSLSETDKDSVRKMFIAGLDEKLDEADKLIRKVDVALEISKISKYISLSRIASDYFGKSKEWLYQRVKGYTVNGKPAEFTTEERKIFSSALEDISQLTHNTSLKIA